MGFLQELFGTESHKTTEDEIRGWSVLDDTDREIGRVDDLMYDDKTHEVRYAVVNIDNRRKLIPIGQIDVDDNRRVVRARGFSRDRLLGMRDYDRTTWSDMSEREHYREHVPSVKESDKLDYTRNEFRGQVPRRIQLLEEELRIGKRRVKTGEATISKHAVTERVNEKVDLETDRLDINRRPVHRPAEGQIMGENETIRVPLYTEEPVVDKKTFVKEEIEIGTKAEKRTETVSEELRREELDTRDLENKRELTFTGTEPTAKDRIETRRERVKEDVDILPVDTKDENRDLL